MFELNWMDLVAYASAALAVIVLVDEASKALAAKIVRSK